MFALWLRLLQNVAGRVAASLLRAAGLPELITDNLQQYESLALKLARDPALLRSYPRPSHSRPRGAWGDDGALDERRAARRLWRA